MAEFVPEKYQGSLCSLVNCGDACVMIFQAIYYLFCKNWLYLHIFNLLSACFIILLVMLLPESPQYFYANKKFDKAREALIRIAKLNGKTLANQKFIETIKFDTEAIESYEQKQKEIEQEIYDKTIQIELV